MTKRLQEAIKLVESLPPEKQDQIADLLIGEIESDRQWDDRFAATQDELERLATAAQEREKRGESVARGWDEL